MVNRASNKNVGVVKKTVRGQEIACIQPGSEAMESLLQVGYGMTIDEAKKIIAERDANPQAWPLEEYRKAKAMLEAYSAQPEVVSSTPGWKRQRDAF